MGHYSPISYPTSLRHGGLGADVSGYAGLVFIANGAAGQVTIGPGLDFNPLTTILQATGGGTGPGTLEVSVGGFSVGTRPELNFIPGVGISITGLDNILNDRVDITIEAGGSTPTNSNYAQIIRPLETPSGTVDGVNGTFVLAQAPATGSEHIYINGRLINTGYSILGNTITFSVIPQYGDEILVDYWPPTPTISAQRITRETPTGTVNGVTTAFTIANSITAGTSRVWKNGRELAYTTDYTISGTTLTFVTSPQVGDELLTSYWTAGGNTPIYSIFQETPSGTIDGTNRTFGLANTPAIRTVHLYKNGILMSPFTEYLQTGNSILMVDAPGLGDTLDSYYDTITSGIATFGITPTGTPNGVLTTFTLPATPTTIAVYVDGVRIYPTAFSVSGTTLTFTTPPQLGDLILVDMTS